MLAEEYRAPARILSTSPAGNIVAEVAQDVFMRWPELNGPGASVNLLAAARSLLNLGQYIATFRIRTTRESVMREEEFQRLQRNFVDHAAHWVSSTLRWQRSDKRLLSILDKRDAEAFNAILAVADKLAGLPGVGTNNLLAALSFLGGCVLAFKREGVIDPIVDNTIARFAAVLREICARAPAASIRSVHSSEQMDVVLMALAYVVPELGHNSQRHVREIAANGSCVAQVCMAAVFDPVEGIFATSRMACGEREKHASTILAHPLVSDIASLTDALSILVNNPATAFTTARTIAGLLYASATTLLVEFEKAMVDPFGSPASSRLLATTLIALLTVLESILQRFFIDDAYLGVKDEELVDLWGAIVDTMANVHFITLAFGREGVDVFKRTSTLAIQFILRKPAFAIDRAVSKIFVHQPCLTFAHPATSISRMRGYLVLFYLDLFEHLVKHLSTHTLSAFVLPLASKYAGSQAIQNIGAEWFESAHAVILSILELVAAEDTILNDMSSDSKTKRLRAEAVLEIVPWYTNLLLELYPDSGISAELLKIAYTAAVRAATTNNAHSNVRVPLPFNTKEIVDFNLGYALAWDRITRLIQRVDDESQQTGGGGNVANVVRGARRRDLLLVLVEQLTTVPLILLPRLMEEVEKRVVDEPDWANRNAVVDGIQEIVLQRADLARKPALSTWIWRLRSDANALLDRSKI